VASFASPDVALRLALAALVAIGALSACESKAPAETRTDVPAGTAVGARLQSKGGSALKGLVVFKPRAGGVTMVISLQDIAPGPYRVAIHTTGNCSSPNTFSAGPPWTPSGGAPQVYNVAAGNNNLVMTTASLDGVAIEGPNGVLGKSVVVHYGLASPLTTQPGVANDRIACGVIERMTGLEF
jgi:Cu-Zn family superoxide dismutase